MLMDLFCAFLLIRLRMRPGRLCSSEVSADGSAFTLNESQSEWKGSQFVDLSDYFYDLECMKEIALCYFGVT